MGRLITLLPFTYTAMLIGSLSLLATPWLTGFYSKDLIIELAYGSYSFSGTYAFILGSVTAGLTAFYSFRLISLVFLTIPNGSKSNYSNTHEANLPVIISLTTLALFSIFIGYIGSDIFTGLGSSFFGNALFVLPQNIAIVEAEFSINPIIKLLPLILTISGSVLALIGYNLMPRLFVDLTDSSLGRKIYSFLNTKYYFDIIYNRYVIGSGLKLGYVISKVLDRGVIELLGPYGISNMFVNTGLFINKSDTGIVTTYALYTTLSLLFLIFIVMSPLLVDITISSEIRLLIIYLAAVLTIA